MKSQALVRSMAQHILIGALILGFMLVTTGGNAHAQGGSDLAMLDHVQGEVLVDVYDDITEQLIAEDVPLEEYVKNTLPGEWFAGSDDENALRAGAVAIRSFALNYIDRRVTLYDGERGQNYVSGSSHPRSDAATDGTDGLYMAMGYNVCVDDDASIEAQYSAETGNPTDDWTDQPFPFYPYLVGVDDEHTQQATIRPGMCQLGSQWYATDPAHLFDHLDILQHYYTDWVSRLIGGSAGGCIVADTDCDCEVGLFDLVNISSRYGINSQDPNWDPQFNITKSSPSTCTIDLFDLVVVGNHYAETCQF